MISCANSNTSSSLETVKLLINSGADLNIQSTHGFTALTVASQYQHTSSSLETVKLLIDSGCDVNIMSDYGDTCLSYLVLFSKSLDVIKTVVSKNSIVNNLSKMPDENKSRKEYNGNSLLHWCCIGIKGKTSSYEILRFLETLDIDKTLKNSEGKRYLDYLSVCYYVSTICEICDTENAIMVVLNCSCNCGRQCIDCAYKLDKCSYCKKTFEGFKIIKMV